MTSIDRGRAGTRLRTTFAALAGTLALACLPAVPAAAKPGDAPTAATPGTAKAPAAKPTPASKGKRRTVPAKRCKKPRRTTPARGRPNAARPKCRPARKPKSAKPAPKKPAPKKPAPAQPPAAAVPPSPVPPPGPLTPAPARPSPRVTVTLDPAVPKLGQTARLVLEAVDPDGIITSYNRTTSGPPGAPGGSTTVDGTCVTGQDDGTRVGRPLRLEEQVTFDRAGIYRFALRVTTVDRHCHGPEQAEGWVEVEVQPGPPAGPPSVQLRLEPASPQVGQPVKVIAEAVDADGVITAVSATIAGAQQQFSTACDPTTVGDLWTVTFAHTFTAPGPQTITATAASRDAQCADAPTSSAPATLTVDVQP